MWAPVDTCGHCDLPSNQSANVQAKQDTATAHPHTAADSGALIRHACCPATIQHPWVKEAYTTLPKVPTSASCREHTTPTQPLSTADTTLILADGNTMWRNVTMTHATYAANISTGQSWLHCPLLLAKRQHDRLGYSTDRIVYFP